MQRITGADTIDLGAGKPGFRDRNRGAGLAGTKVLAAWLNNVQEEVARTIELAGITLDGSSREQLFRAICRLGPGEGNQLATGTHDLTADDMGMAFVSAVSGPTVINLPGANVTGRPMRLTLVRWEAAHSVTVNATGGDQLEYVVNGALTIPPLERITLVSNGLDQWVVEAEAVRNRVISPIGRMQMPGGLIMQWGNFTTSAAADVWVAFPVAFDSCFQPLVSHNSYNAPTVGSVGSNGFTDEGFWAVSYAGGSRTMADGRYIALGV